MNILTNTTENYKRWKDKKLGTFTKNPDELTVHITSPNAISKPEKSMVISLLENHNIVFFHIDSVRQTSKTTIKNFASLLLYEYFLLRKRFRLLNCSLCFCSS